MTPAHSRVRGAYQLWVCKVFEALGHGVGGQRSWGCLGLVCHNMLQIGSHSGKIVARGCRRRGSHAFRPAGARSTESGASRGGAFTSQQGVHIEIAVAIRTQSDLQHLRSIDLQKAPEFTTVRGRGVHGLREFRRS